MTKAFVKGFFTVWVIFVGLLAVGLLVGIGSAILESYGNFALLVYISFVVSIIVGAIAAHDQKEKDR